MSNRAVLVRACVWLYMLFVLAQIGGIIYVAVGCGHAQPTDLSNPVFRPELAWLPVAVLGLYGLKYGIQIICHTNLLIFGPAGDDYSQLAVLEGIVLIAWFLAGGAVRTNS